MKRFVVVLSVLVLVAGSAYAQPQRKKQAPLDMTQQEMWQMCQQLMGSGMMGPGMMGGGMMGQGMMGGMGMMGGIYFNPQVRKFLDETVEMRRTLLLKRFEYFEAVRNPDTPTETIMKLTQELRKIMSQLYEKAPMGYMGPWGYEEPSQ